MSKKRNILMCLQQLDIGGVETAVVTLCKGYIRAGHKVYVAAKKGIFSKQLEKIGVEVLDLEYEFLQTFPLDKKKQLIKYVQDKNITEIHIHQYPCVLYWLPVCLELKIPYVAYVHSIVGGAPQWFMQTFPVHRFALPLFFENASKIVCIAEKTKEEIATLFPVPNEKFKIIPNSLNMEDFKLKETPKKITTFGIVARLAEEKELSIKKSIDLFKSYLKENANSKLLIAGDGPSKKNLESYANSKNIEFIGATSDIPKFMNDIDIFMGVDRCILEACASKCLAIISSYNGNLCLLDKTNIKRASEVNFSGVNLEPTKDILEKIMKIDSKKYSKIVEENYNFINENYNVDKNLYIDILDNNYPSEYQKMLPVVNDYLKELENLNNYVNYLNNRRLTTKIKNLSRRVINKIKRTLNK